jgi:hypothetical protein
MNFRLFSKKANLYTNSPFWPSNQRTTSEFALLPTGGIIEIVRQAPYEDEGDFVVEHDSRNFVVEPWSGYFDSAGRKIYLGDILEMVVFETEYQVVWRDGEFILKDLTEEHIDLSMRNCSHHTITGNIYGIEYAD